MCGAYLGQCFLKDKKYVDSIINRINKISDDFDFIIEIGPGKGALTKRLVNIGKPVYLLERDQSFKDILEKIVPSENIVWGDVLDLDVAKFINDNNLTIEKALIVGNLPYYITSPILRMFTWDTIFQNGIFMIQKEVGEKIKNDATKKSYLRWILNYSHNIKLFKNVPAKAFSPAPKVDSCLIHIQKGSTPNINREKLLRFLDIASPFKRKTLAKIFKMKAVNDMYLDENLGKKRIEELTRLDLEYILRDI
ncbi:MAG: rRNA adenine dimethyltransferase family protein [Candidatus Absconditabacteria bacterium]